MKNAAPKIVLTTSELSTRIAPMLEPETADTTQWLAIETIPDAAAEQWRAPGVDAESLAFLQYTSGSTAHPKGVMVSHANLLANHRMIKEAFGLPDYSNIVNWLPHFHDMGLIGNLLQSMYAACQCAIMPPEAFLMKPLRWLQAISQYGAQFSGGPNFAYALCVQRVSDEQKAALDLGKWELAFTGAEPVRAATLERFAQAFAPCGFRREALYPCYGLAEATLFVTGPRKLEGFHAAPFQTASLAEHKVVLSARDEKESRTLTGCGNIWQDGEIVIVDPATGTRCKPNEIGEIWVAGPNVTQGYWNLPDQTQRTFHATLADEDSSTAKKFLRTGDYGFLHEGNLFIAGRLKDHIIITGRNHHAGDIEHTVEQCHPAIRQGGCVAIAVETGEEERLVVMAELNRGVKADEIRQVDLAVRRAVAEHHDVMPHTVELLKPAACPRTSSGKIMRGACREGFLADTLNKWKEGE